MTKKNKRIDSNNTICMFYVANRLKDFLDLKKENEVKIDVQEFLDEIIYNLGVNSIINFQKENNEKLN